MKYGLLLIGIPSEGTVVHGPPTRLWMRKDGAQPTREDELDQAQALGMMGMFEHIVCHTVQVHPGPNGVPMIKG